MRIKGVSPLIATIILVALTVSIGAIIVGWGRSYIQRQIKCTSYSADLYIAQWKSQNSVLEIKFVNSGIEPILKDDLLVIIFDTQGGKHVCGKDTLNTEGCSHSSGSPSRIDPGNYTIFSVDIPDATTWRDYIVGGELWLEIIGCGRISPTIEITT